MCPTIVTNKLNCSCIAKVLISASHHLATGTKKKGNSTKHLSATTWLISINEGTPPEFFLQQVATFHVCVEPFQSCASSEETCKLDCVLPCTLAEHAFVSTFLNHTCSYMFHKCSTRELEYQVHPWLRIYLMAIIVAPMQTRHHLNHEEC